ncbi:MAG: hypothetical protein ACYCOU_25515 [Sulfobacillus sp.]|jgi:hypothetical protein
MARYLIPKPISKKYELFPGSGWGLVEAGIVVAGLIAGALLFLFATLLGLPIIVRLVLAALTIAIGGALAFPPPQGEPAYQIVLRWRNYQRQPHRYVYDWTVSDWPDDLNP